MAPLNFVNEAKKHGKALWKNFCAFSLQFWRIYIKSFNSIWKNKVFTKRFLACSHSISKWTKILQRCRGLARLYTSDLERSFCKIGSMSYSHYSCTGFIKICLIHLIKLSWKGCDTSNIIEVLQAVFPLIHCNWHVFWTIAGTFINIPINRNDKHTFHFRTE